MEAGMAQVQEMQKCIDQCLDCYSTCSHTMMQHCLEAGGPHVAPDHIRLMQACIEICRASAAMMLTGTAYHKNTCALCADICAACAEDCERIGDMQSCVDACRACAESCRRMAA
jgi:hypothetical protein